MGTIFKARQLQYIGVLQQLFPNVANETLDVLLQSINADLTVPLRIDATSTPSLIVDIGPSVISNPESNRQKSISFINSLIPAFSGGTVTFPTSGTGNVTTSTGGSSPLAVASGQYCSVLLMLDAYGNLLALPGTAASSQALAIVPSPNANTLPIGYIVISNIGGTIQPIQQANCYQFTSGSGGGAGGGGGVAESVSIPSGSTSINITLPVAQASNSYVVIPQFSNVVDAYPQFQPITVTSKSTTGFVASWNGPTSSANYKLDYTIAPGIVEQAGELGLASGTTSVTITPPIALTSASYVVIATLTNYTDSSVEFQPVTITAKSPTSFTASWNGPLSDSNYRLAWQLATYQS